MENKHVYESPALIYFVVETIALRPHLRTLRLKVEYERAHKTVVNSMKSDDRAFGVFGCRHFDLCEAAGSVNNLIRQSLRDGKRVLKDDYMCRRRGSVMWCAGAGMTL